MHHPKTINVMANDFSNAGRTHRGKMGRQTKTSVELNHGESIESSPRKTTSTNGKSSRTSQSQSQDGNTAMCDICSKIFSCRAYLNSHLRSHQNDRPYKCTDCGKSFKRTGNLAEHRKIHSGLKEYGCNICGKAFIQQSSQIVHMRSHTGERPFKCETCSKAFRKIGDLNVHKKIHNNDRRYQCAICDRRFLRANVLTEHLRLHSGVKAFKCRICNATFRTTTDFSRHKNGSVDCNIVDNVAEKLKANGLNGMKNIDSADVCIARIVAQGAVNVIDIHGDTEIIDRKESCIAERMDISTNRTNYLVIEPADVENPDVMADTCDWLNATYLDEGDVYAEELVKESLNKEVEDHVQNIEPNQHENLSAHQSSISDKNDSIDRKFICPACGKMFKKLHHLTAHERTHTGEGNYRNNPSVRFLIEH